MTTLSSHERNTAGNCRTCGTTYPCNVVVRDEFTMQYDERNHFPFIEDENANITGYGHQGKAEFAAAVNRYDAVCNGEPIEEYWDATLISHSWAVALDDERFTTRDVTPTTPGAFPITTLWGQR